MKMNLHNYRTGEYLRAMTAVEAVEYMATIKGGPAEGVVDGAIYGYDFSVYAT